MIKTLGGDWGSYLAYNQAIQFNFPLMIEKLNLGFMVYRGCQEQISSTNGNYSTLANLAASRKAGVPINACYYWHYPDGSQSYYLALYKSAIERENPDFIGVDIEQTSVYVDGVYRIVDPQVMSDTAQQLCEGLASLFPEKRVVPYTRQDIISHYSPQMKNWIGKFDGAWVAGWPDYGEESYELSWEQIAQLKMKSAYDGSIIDVDDFDAPVLLGQTDTKIWQYSSRIRPPVQGFPYDHQYDWNVFYGSVDQMKQWMNKKEITPTMAGTYKTNVLTKDRGHFVWLSGDDKNVDMVGVSAGTDAAFLRMCSQVTGNMTVSKDNAFPIWTDRATKPVVGVVEMDQNLFWNKEIDLNKFKARTMWTNETLKAILEQWHIAQIPQAEWDAKKLNITAKEGWHNISGLVLFMSTTYAKSSLIGGAWQQAIVDDLLKPLTTLMEGGYIPTVKIYVMASWDWYRVYATNPEWNPAARIANKQLAGLGLTRVWGQSATGLMTEVPMAIPYATLAEVWQHAPADNYVYPISLEEIDFQFFVFSFNRLRANGAFYPGATVTPITCGMWCDTAANMGLGSNVVVPPPEPPVDPPVEPPVDPLLEARVKALEDKAVAMQAEIDDLKDLDQDVKFVALKQSVAELQASNVWMKKFITDVIDLYLKSIA